MRNPQEKTREKVGFLATSEATDGLGKFSEKFFKKRLTKIKRNVNIYR